MRTLLHLLRRLRPRWGRLLLVAVLGAGAVGAGIGLIGTAALVIAAAALHPSIAELQVAIVGIRAFGLARVVLRYLERLAAHDQALRLLGRLRSWLLEALVPLAPGNLVGLQRGDLLARLVGDLDSLQSLLARGMAPVVIAAIVMVGCLGLVASSSPEAALGLAGVYLAGALMVPTLVAGTEGRAGARVGTARSALSRAVVDLCDGSAELVVWGAQAAWTRRFARAEARLQAAQRRAALVAALEPALELLQAHIAVWLVLVAAIPSVVPSLMSDRAGLAPGGAGGLDGIMLAVLCLIVMASFEALAPLATAARELAGQVAAAGRIFEIVDREPSVRDPDHAPAPSPGTLAGGISAQLCGVSFTYPGRDQPAVRELDLCLEPGDRVGIVGASGSGKTTLARLLQRYWDPQEGNVLIDGRDAAEYRLTDLRRAVGALDQQPLLLAGTIRECLQLARPDATDGELLEALHEVAFDLEGERLPAGLDTWIGEHGVTLSGGQRQRLALARTVLLDPALLILDEPTVALDPITGRALWRSLAQLMRGRTCLVISHRITRLAGLDRIVVLDKGRIVQSGAHDELCASDGPYRELLRLEQELLDA